MKSNSFIMESLKTQSSALGVCTRSRALALLSGAGENSGGLYIQLRNRRLEKKLMNGGAKRQRRMVRGNPNPNSTPNLKLRGNSETENAVEKEEDKIVADGDDAGGVDSAVEGADDGVHSPIEGTFGDDLFENEGNGEGSGAGRFSRETTPCHLIRDPNVIRAPPISSTRRTRSQFQPNRVIRNQTFKVISTQELEEIFGTFPKEHQKKFIEKYNFDIVNDRPLPGRYEWVKIDP